MMIKNAVDSRPWYREPWPWLLMLGPAVVVVAGFVTAWLAIRSSDGLVEDDYYKQGLAVNQQKARDNLAATLGLKAAATVGADGRVELRLSARDVDIQPAAVVLRLTHPTRSGSDQQATLRREGNVYIGRLPTMPSGRWHVALEDETRTWRMTGDWEPEKQAVLQLPAASRVFSNHHGG